MYDSQKKYYEKNKKKIRKTNLLTHIKKKIPTATDNSTIKLLYYLNKELKKTDKNIEIYGEMKLLKQKIEVKYSK